MREQSGHVTVNERVPSQRFNRFVDERLQTWLTEHQLSQETTEYEVAFFDEEPLGEVSCLIVIHSGERLWRSWESADTPRVALRRSLERLHDDLAGGRPTAVAVNDGAPLLSVTH